jgi:2'-5' RNA ligase
VRSEDGTRLGERTEQARVFFALWPSPESARQLAEVADSFAKCAGGRPTRQEAMHLTLTFIGDVPVGRLPDLERATREVRGEAFTLTLDRLGIWRHNRIFQAGCSVSPPALVELRESLNTILQAAGFSVADTRRSFTPHVTLVHKMVTLDAELPDYEAIAWNNRQFVLARSSVSVEGSSYRIVAEFPLPAGAG